MLAFIPVFWWQAIAAEVYTLHVFLVVWMVWLLWRWEETREFYFLVVFSLVTGLSFGNHVQTVMLAPARSLATSGAPAAWSTLRTSR